jgi:DUF1680 family protein
MARTDRVLTIGVNCGGPAIDGLAADRPYVPGQWGYDKGLPWSIKNSAFPRRRDTIENDYGYPSAFETLRYHAGAPLHYRFDLPNGYYQLRLYFAEQWRDKTGARVFDVRVNGETILDHFDIVKEAGRSCLGVERVFTGLPVTDGQLDIEFVTVEGDPVVSIIVVTREGEHMPPPARQPRYQSSAADLERVNDNNRDLISYYGAWSIHSGLEGYTSGDCHRSNIQGSAVDFSFKGARVTWIGSRNNDHGRAEVHVDGALKQIVDTYAPHLEAGQVLFEQSGLSADRYHTIRVSVTRDRNAASADCYQEIDAFECEQAVDVADEIAKVAYAELATIKAGRRTYPSPDTWRKVEYEASAPRRGVVLQAGLFKTTMERNVAYVNACFGLEDWIASSPNWWIRALPASNEGRLLAGAAHALRWEENADMRNVVTTIVNAIADRQRPDGYVLPFDEGSLAGEPSEKDERRNYDRTMFTKGLIAAYMSGDERAAGILRRFYDWFNDSQYVNNLLEGSLGCQGHVASTLVGLMPFGKPEDLIVGERFYVQDWLLDELAKEEPLGIYKYPINRPHCYYVTLIEAYLDHYRANGDARYLAATKGAWKVYRDDFIHIGGSAAISEWGYGTYPPRSFQLGRGNGELCGSVFWIDLCHRLLQLYPEEEVYASEIERSIYNVALANQEVNGAIRYHARLHDKKESGQIANTCCEVMGTGLYGRLPQYIYSIAEDGLYVNLYEPSTITWQHLGQQVSLSTVTAFPYGPDVALRLMTSRPRPMKIRLRVPRWASKEVQIRVNDRVMAEGKAGTYITLDRTWADNDHINFTLPIDFRLTRYEGFDQVNGWDRYALEYGPLLMALSGSLDDEYKQPNGQSCSRLQFTPEELTSALESVVNQPLHFRVKGDADHKYLPYFEVSTETFTCLPIVG